MAEYDFSLTYDGPALDSGRMEVRDLAPALIAFGDLFREANALLYPEAPPVSLEIRATEAGSFHIALIMVRPDLVIRAVQLFSGSAATGLVNLYTFIIGSGGLLVLLRKMYGKSVERTEQLPDGIVRLIMNDGTIIEVPDETLRLYGSVNIRRRVREVMTPLGREGIDEITITDGNESAVIPADDLPVYDIPNLPDTPLVERESTEALTIANVAFTDGNKWRFSNGAVTFYADVADEDFLNAVEAGEPFRKNDILLCSMKMKQWQGEGGLRTEYTVDRVLEHIPSARQVPLPFETVEDTGAAAEAGSDFGVLVVDDVFTRGRTLIEGDEHG
jgi:hypothetical protein